MTTSQNEAWPIQRRWLLLRHDAEPLDAAIDEILERRVVVFLGAAGLGKTWELTRLSAGEERSGRTIRFHRLAELTSAHAGIGVALDAITAGSDAGTCLYLDALDELTTSVKAAALAMQAWLKRVAFSHAARIRISCRSAVWPGSLTHGLLEIFGADNVAVVALQPLSDEDVRAVVRASGLDVGTFMAAVERARAVSLASFPLTLRMLMRLCSGGRQLPEGRRDVFRQAALELARDSQERRDMGTGNAMEPSELLAIAEELACLALLCGREVVDLGDESHVAALGLTDAAHLNRPEQALDDGVLRKIGLSGLFEGAGAHRFRFLHRQIAEYLAGRRVATLPPHQVKQLLACGDGIAGPLRETAAFAAIESQELAEWIAAFDPEVIGLSDVADDQLRRAATKHLLERFRLHQLTLSQLGRDGIELRGFRYVGGAADVRDALRERDADHAEFLQCAIELSEACGYTGELSEDLADLSLDANAPLEARKAALRALRDNGRPEARARAKPLINGVASDGYEDLKGLALQCLWPGSLTTNELLDVLTRPKRKSYLGPYEFFIGEVAHDDSVLEQDSIRWLAWCLHNAEHAEYSLFLRLVRRVVRKAIGTLDSPGVRDALAAVLLEYGERLVALVVDPEDDDAGGRGRRSKKSPLSGNRDLRRVVLQALVMQDPTWDVLFRVLHDAPGLVETDDFAWLLERATDASQSMGIRTLWAHVAEHLPWKANPEAVDLWRLTRHIEPITAIMEDPDVAMKRWREFDEKLAALAKSGGVEPVASAAEMVAHALGLAETDDARHFLNVSRALTLKDGDQYYGFNRFLARTPGWAAAPEATRARIIGSAERFLDQETDVPETCVTEPLNSILAGHISALFLVLEHDRPWLELRNPEWWARWSWYLLREIRPILNDEANEPKQNLFDLLWRNAAASVREHMGRSASAPDVGLSDVLSSGLHLLARHADSALDEMLCAFVEAGRIWSDRLGMVTEFLIERGSVRAMDACMAIVSGATAYREIGEMSAAGCALLRRNPVARWETFMKVIEADEALARRIVANYAHHEDRNGGGFPIADLGEVRVGELLVVLFWLYSPNTDPDYDDVHWVSPDDSARTLRMRLVNWLAGRGTESALEALRRLEARHAKEHTWLRRMVADAARDLRLGSWAPLPTASVAAMLLNSEKQLVASDRDAMEAIVYVLSRYEARLHGSPPQVRGLWNTLPNRVWQKEEDFVSDQVCIAIRDYFSRHAVTADREVQVYRRQVAGGVSGSELDVLVRVPAMGSASSEAIAVPIEVKKSENPEARTGLKAQLVDRYMAQLGATCGVFIVAWMDAPGLEADRRPVWSAMELARVELEGQAKEAGRGATRVRAVVLDASLR